MRKGVASKCEEFDIDVDTLKQLASGAIDRDPSWKTVPCKNGWTYDDSVQSSIVIDYDLVCQYDILPTVALAVLNTGSLMGVALCGYISD
ncbi:unnamed protein product [Cyprideis torosa]|uniref:Uncharacterized protein n=1 Tax=Cyprideis torosa TaxID=163714 RepID=A0A7R8WN30_9CRUS|nr:unnamed protein product [Cyprideis torosa]CAG0903551.1 unnamed protein product [Cyprideis torosa]